MLILADTSCWIEFFPPDGDEAVRAQLLRWLADGLAICGPVRTEVLRGVRKEDAAKIVSAFAALPHLSSVDGDWLRAEQNTRALVDKGCNVPLVDVFIAAIALRHNAVLAHKDEHFQAIAQVLPLRTHNFLA